jgi:hypothetical protein
MQHEGSARVFSREVAGFESDFVFDGDCNRDSVTHCGLEAIG